MHSFCFFKRYLNNFSKVFLVTGGDYFSDDRHSYTTEILQEPYKNWIVLKTGDLPYTDYNIYGLGLATVNNEVFAFGNILNHILHIHFIHKNIF